MRKDLYICSRSIILASWWGKVISDIESLKADKLDKTDFNAYKTSTDKAIADNTKSIKANTTAIDKCVIDIANNSALINQNHNG